MVMLAVTGVLTTQTPKYNKPCCQDIRRELWGAFEWSSEWHILFNIDKYSILDVEINTFTIITYWRKLMEVSKDIEWVCWNVPSSDPGTA